MTHFQGKLSDAIGFLRVGELKKAEALLRQILKAQPQNACAIMYLGVVASQTGHHNAAEQLLRQSLEIDPSDPGVYFNLASVLERDNKVDEAISFYHQASTREPNNVQCLIKLGNCYKYVGEIEKAIVYYRHALTFTPDNVNLWKNLVMVKRFKTYDDDARAIENLLSPPGLSMKHRIQLHFTLGKIHEDINDYSASFSHYNQGNSLMRSTFQYDISERERQLEAMEQILTHNVWATIPDSGILDETPIFVVGMPRSGTSLTEQILACHPQVFAAGELLLLKDAVNRHPSFAEHGYPEAQLHMGADNMAELGRYYLDGIRSRDAQAFRITDKMPQNYVMLGLIPKILPGAKIIHCRRDPIDTCVSCYSLLFTEGQHYSYDLDELGRYYRSYQRLMAHWRKLLGDSILELDYEALVAEPEVQIRRLLAFCGLHWDDACLQFHRSKRAVRTSSAAQVRQPIHDRSLRRGQRFRPFLAPLIEALEQ